VYCVNLRAEGTSHPTITGAGVRNVHCFQVY